jgi:lysozyme family protein
MTDRFPICLPYILKEEGGNSDDPNDPGGRTSRGIIQREYDAYRTAEGQATQDVYQATDAEVSNIYLTQYWQPFCPQLSAGPDLCLFDMNVNGGPAESAKLLQRALGVTADGHIGLITLAAVKAANPIKLVSNFSDQRRAFYQGLRTFKYFGKGWMARVQTIEQAALKMAAEAS